MMVVILESIQGRVTIAGLTVEQFARFCALVDASTDGDDPSIAWAGRKLGRASLWVYHRPTECFALWCLTWREILLINAVLIWALVDAPPKYRISLADELLEAIDVAIGMRLRQMPTLSRDVG